MELTRICTKCGRELPLSRFYRYLPSCCMDCKKESVRENYLRKSEDPAFIEKERERGREKYRRLGYRNKRSDGSRLKSALYSSASHAKRDLGAKVPADLELHHWNYHLPKEVIVLPRRLHHRVHTGIKLNLTEGIYYQGDNRLDTLEKHLSFIKGRCAEFGFDFSKIQVLSK